MNFADDYNQKKKNVFYTLTEEGKYTSLDLSYSLQELLLSFHFSIHFKNRMCNILAVMYSYNINTVHF